MISVFSSVLLSILNSSCLSSWFQQSWHTVTSSHFATVERPCRRGIFLSDNADFDNWEGHGKTHCQPPVGGLRNTRLSDPDRRCSARGVVPPTNQCLRLSQPPVGGLRNTRLSDPDRRCSARGVVPPTDQCLWLSQFIAE